MRASQRPRRDLIGKAYEYEFDCKIKCKVKFVTDDLQEAEESLDDLLASIEEHERSFWEQNNLELYTFDIDCICIKELSDVDETEVHDG